MLKNFGLLIAATTATLTFAGSASHAEAGCPFAATASADGCAGAIPASTTQFANFFTGYAAQSGQGPYRVRPAWNVAGVDYPVGFYTSLANLTDVRKSQPAGCSLRQYGASTALACTGSGALVITNYRFDLDGGTWLLINSTKYTSAVVKNSYFLNGASTDRVGGALIIVGSLSGDFTLSNTTLDGAGRTNSAGLLYLVEDTRGGTQRDFIQRNAFFRMPQKGVGTGPCGDTSIVYNYFEELEASSAHGEFTIDGTTACTKNSLALSYNTFLLTAGLVRTGDSGVVTLMYLSGGNPSRSWNGVLASNNTLVANNIGTMIAPGPGAAITSRIIEGGYGQVHHSLRYLNNFIDPTGALLCYYVPVPTPASTVVSGNVNLLDGSSIDDFSAASCAGHNSGAINANPTL